MAPLKPAASACSSWACPDVQRAQRRVGSARAEARGPLRVWNLSTADGRYAESREEAERALALARRRERARRHAARAPPHLDELVHAVSVAVIVAKLKQQPHRSISKSEHRRAV